MSPRISRLPRLALLAGAALAGLGIAAVAAAQTITTVPGMPPVTNPANLYSDAGAGQLSPAVAGDLARIYVPNRRSNSISVIDPATLQVIDTYKVGRNPQHVVPSWDL